MGALPTFAMARRLSKRNRLQILDDALGWILATPQDWNQDSYVCRTGFCVAGHIAALSPYAFEKDLHGYLDDILVDRRGNLVTDADTYAREVLGLGDTSAEEDNLFDAGNSITELFRLRNVYAANRGLPARELPDQKTLDRAQAIAWGSNEGRTWWSNPQSKDYIINRLRDRHELRGVMLQVAWGAYKTEVARQKRLAEQRSKAHATDR